MKTVDRDAGSGETPRQLIGEENIRELRLTVGADGAITPFTAQIIEIDRAKSMRLRRNVHDPRGRALLDAIEQQHRYQEVGEVVDREDYLDPVHGHDPRGIAQAGVVDQSM